MPIYVIDKIKQKNNGTFKLMDATDVVMKNGKDVETTINEIKIGAGEGIKTANDLLVLLETDNTGRMIVDLNEAGDKVEIHLDNTFVDTLLTTSKLGEPNGVVPLDGNRIIPTKYLPGSVDEILEYDTFSAFPETGEASKIYVDKSTNKTYRWGGTTYVEISASLALGTSESMAYPGNLGAQNARDISTLRTGKQDKLIAGANIEIQGTTISSKLTPATANVIGGIKVGEGLKVDSTGLLSVNFATTEEIQAMFATTPLPTDELIGTWVFNFANGTEATKISSDINCDISFTSNSTNYSQLRLQNYKGRAVYVYYDSTLACDDGNGWQNNAYKTIKITDVSNLTNRTEFENFLKANATKQSNTTINEFKINAGASGLIDDTVFLTFQYEDGMTFEQFINSKYNVEQNAFSKIYSVNNVILLSYMSNSFWIATNEQGRIEINEKINKDLNYFLTFAGTDSNAGGGVGGK